jgi:hypothetical protein
MKLTKIAVCVAVAGAMTFAASKTSAFPLDLKSITATLTVTTNYSTLTSPAKYLRKTVSTKQVLQLVTNAVYMATGTNPPAGVRIAWDPWLNNYPYLTNNLGYTHSLSGIAYAYVEDIATSFKGNGGSGGSESDVIVFYLDIYGYDLNNKYFEIYQDYGTGTLSASAKSSGITTMTISSTGGGYGELYNSDDGVSYGKVTFKGTGQPTTGQVPYSLWWY